ncbi:hypothetical protein [Staphylococcus intermedius]|uniref:Uncharacterized protein n=1 Tax=Staphylococcus intermedius NCTC 11048 TaxID=1141106 RepID=A0A380G975_STAIN|nr:hypothetical protein [Staphylococcus intermedius]PCF65129.1 hypothetical protein B5C04_03505 [Staphylococcus intermedius]PCF80739.1 hypothetical protein B4W74_03520 [Staphylococcus intermedius]PCF82088.1 hypothetical protein B4W70_03500 [Staphylococcus intermedius]PCF88424.1 hypothetical protein B4W75_06545 [Staphylococcus intermedius]PCF89139.1 hypothetical protein B4W76_02540 [Staphylococcus intermedius]
MDIKKWPLYYDFYKKRSSTRWALNLLIAVLFGMLSGQLFSQALSDEKSLSFEGVDQHSALIINRTIFSITVGFTVLFSMLFFFILSLVVAKILKTKPSAKSLFSGAVLLVLVINVVTLIVAIIQFLFGLNPEDYNILSLNVFNAGNQILAAFDLKLTLQSYLFMLL